MAAVGAATRQKRQVRRDSESTLILPKFREPQKAQLVKHVPTADDWLFEAKYDGYRGQVAIAGDKVRIYTRNGNDWTAQFGYLVPAFSQLTEGTALIDGELCALDDRGRPNFTLLKNSLDGETPIVFFAFDLLEQDRVDITQLPLVERKKRLQALLSKLPKNSPIYYSDHIVGHGQKVFEHMCKHGLEGLVAKRSDSRYISGDRSSAWQKVKCVQRQEFIVIGWRPPAYGNDVRGLFLATYEGDELVYRGSVGTGFTDKMRWQVLKTLEPLQTGKRPKIAGMPRPEMRVAKWVEPTYLAEVEFTEITPDGLVRHPSFKGLREDKSADEVHLEEAV